MDLARLLLAPEGVPFVYGTTPPRDGSAEAVIEGAARQLTARTRPLPLDGFVVYDLQDESARTELPRPFPFTGTTDPRDYARRLTALSGRPALTYKCIGELDEPAWTAWLDETAAQGHRCLSLVGRPSSRGGSAPLTLSRAYELAASHPAGFLLGGVAIAERCGSTPPESQRMMAKAARGCAYFVTQAVYDAEATVLLLRDYARECASAGLRPRRVLLTFTPCGREKTMRFMQWLGVAISPATERAILTAADPLARSIEVCCDHLRAVLVQPGFETVPLGINLESVSIRKDEIEGSIALGERLAEVLANRPPRP